MNNISNNPCQNNKRACEKAYSPIADELGKGNKRRKIDTTFGRLSDVTDILKDRQDTGPGEKLERRCIHIARAVQEDFFILDKVAYKTEKSVLSPLLFLASANCWSMIDNLLEGKDLSLLDEKQLRSLLRDAVLSKQQNTVNTILRNVPADIRNSLLNSCFRNDNASLFFELCLAGHWEVVKLVLEKGCNVDLKARPTAGPYEGVTPFLLACRSGQQDVAQLILKKDSRANITATSLDKPVAESGEKSDSEILVDLLNRKGV